MEILQKVFTYKLDPSRSTQQLFIQCAGSTRYIYNYGLALLKHALETEKKLLSYKDIANKLPGLKKQ
ncbi:helix-turn-helix domain-containing protein [Candidatus Dependentiae bacterium]|nr:helix-turn-helix domain-containing protein [Tatlockia sp.]MBA3954980.1 helix-turn-helix domain-containing protein [Candidatus Dependentiae bacterium]